MGAFAAARGFDPADYAGLHAWSVAEPDAFWRDVWEECGVIGEPGDVVLGDASMPGASWFPDARLNFAENLLRRRGDGVAVIFRREDGARREISFMDLVAQVARFQAGLLAAGIQPGDRVAAFLPNCPEALIAMLATAASGGVWSSCSPDFGTAGVLDRFGQIAPRFLLTADAYSYGGKTHDCLGKASEIQAGLPTLEHTIVVPYTEDRAPDLSGLDGAVVWRDFEGAAEEPSFMPMPFEAPLYVLFSSGTTGAPKCIVHGAGGTLLQHLKEQQLHTDLGEDDRLFYFTTTGWMMWNWLVAGLAAGATLVLYDGSPMHPGPAALWDLAAEEGVTVFGTSAKFIDACRKAGLAPAESHDLSALRAILSTGSPLVAESFDYVYESVAPAAQLASISGGTDIVSCFMLGVPTIPVRRGEIQGPGLGMAVEIWDADGSSVTGQPGELVCTAPAPSMPVCFWDDADGAKYRAAYFEKLPGVWRHGDWVEATEHGGYVIYGRSDATLNPGGVRIGTAEIYRQVEQMEEVEEGIVVGQDTGDGDMRVVLFVRLAGGLVLDEELEKAIRARIRAQATPRHVPAVIAQVADIPRTRSGKISEIAVREVIHGRPVTNTEALANPAALDLYSDRPELVL